MKKKLEAELISIAHRILKLKNRADIDQLQQETLRLYEKLSVLKFVEDNFNDVKPTIGYASAEEKLEEIYGVADQPKEEEAEEAQGTSQKAEEKVNEEAQEEETPNTEPETQNAEEEPQAISQEPKEEEEADNAETETQNAEEEEEPQAISQEPEEEEEARNAEPETQNTEEDETPNAEPETQNAEEEPQAISQEPEEEEEARNAEPETQNPEEEDETRNAEPETQNPEPKTPKQKEITFEDYHDYKEPEFVKLDEVKEPVSINKEWLPKEPEVLAKQDDNAEAMSSAQPADDAPAKTDDWRSWEPSTSPYGNKKEEPKQEAKKSLNDAFGKTIAFGLNDRIAFEKHLFGGSGEDLNRVLSQLNTFDTFEHAKEFIRDMVKPDYNNWEGKEEYEERFMGLVEKKFD